MHNIKTNFGIFYRMCKQFFKDEADPKGNLQFYPKSPRMADLKVIALSCTMEAWGIDSENLLWSKMKADYPAWSAKLICRSPLQPWQAQTSALYSADAAKDCRTIAGAKRSTGRGFDTGARSEDGAGKNAQSF